MPQKDRCTCSRRAAEPSKFINVGSTDRTMRVVAGVGLLWLGTQTPWAWLGLLPLLTGLIGFCPLYRVFGFTTAGKADITPRRTS